MTESILVRGRWVITAADDEPRVDSAVLVDAGRIVRIAPWAELHLAHPDARLIGDEHSAVIPGLVNAHHHSHAVSALLQGVSDDLLEPWILAWHALRPVDRRLNTLVSAGVQLGAGVTSLIDMMSAGGDAASFGRVVREALAAYDEAGIRAALTPGMASRSDLVSGDGEDDRFLASLPAAVRAQAESLLPGPERLTEDDYFAVMEELQAEIGGHPRVELWYGPPGPQWVSDACLVRCADAAARHDCGIQTHVNESYYEKLHGERFYGQPTMLHLRDLGVLGPRFTIAHGTWLNRAEIEVMAETGAAVSHNPSSNLRLRAGIAPLKALLDAGVTTGLGMDATTLHEDEDMFAEMRLALRLQAQPRIEREVPSARDVYTAATASGVKLLGSEHQLGRLEPGYAADLVVLDTRRLCWPWASPEADPLELIVLRARRADIRRVLIGGETVWADGAPTRFDLEAAAVELAARLEAEPFPAERHAAVQAVKPHVETWYADWPAPEPEPWTRYNSQT